MNIIDFENNYINTSRILNCDYTSTSYTESVYVKESYEEIQKLIKNALHPTQKPVSLLEYFLKTYTEGVDWVLDFTSGSGSLGEACLNTNRNCILIEKYDEWINVSKNRLGESLLK